MTELVSNRFNLSKKVLPRFRGGHESESRRAERDLATGRWMDKRRWKEGNAGGIEAAGRTVTEGSQAQAASVGGGPEGTSLIRTAAEFHGAHDALGLGFFVS